MTGWGWAAMTISMVLFWVVLIFAGVLLYRAVSRSSGGGAAPGPQRATPEQLLAERYARGELSEEEYRRALATLRDSGALTH